MSSSSSCFLFPARVKYEVLAQHSVLRTLLQRVLAATTAGLRRQGLDLGDLAQSAHELHRHFRAHLTFEERSLLPILATDEVWGPERAQDLLEEHARQRGQLDTILEGVETGWDLERLALALRSLTVDLLQDMQEEEEGCLRATLLQEPLIDAPRAR
jgi:hypothetical protein